MRFYTSHLILLSYIWRSTHLNTILQNRKSPQITAFNKIDEITMRYILLILSIMHFGQTFAQSAFYYSHITPYSNAPKSLVECEHGYFLAGDNTAPGFKSNGYLMLFNKDGSIRWEKIIVAPPPDDHESYRAAVYHQGYFYVAGYRWINDKAWSLLLKIDPSNGDVVFSRIFGNEQVYAMDNTISDMLVNEDGLLLASAGFNINSTDAELVQIDLEGNVLWSKFYDADDENVPFFDYLTDVKPMSDGYLLTMSTTNAAWQPFFYLIKTDKQGNEIWRKDVTNYQSPSTGTDTLLYFSSANTYKENHVLLHCLIENLDPLSHNQLLIELDADGNEIYYRKYEEKPGFASTDIFVNERSEIFILGLQGRGAPLYFQLYAIKFDADRNVIWENHYGEENIAELYVCGIPTSDGGVLIGGTNQHFQFGTPYFNSIVVKTDCEGNTEWNKQACISPELEEIVFFPNPFSEQINIHIPNLPKENEVTIRIVDITGKLVDNLTFFNTDVIQINTSSYAVGFYNCSVLVNGELLVNEKIIKGK